MPSSPTCLLFSLTWSHQSPSTHPTIVCPMPNTQPSSPALMDPSGKHHAQKKLVTWPKATSTLPAPKTSISFVSPTCQMVAMPPIFTTSLQITPQKLSLAIPTGLSAVTTLIAQAMRAPRLSAYHHQTCIQQCHLHPQCSLVHDP